MELLTISVLQHSVEILEDRLYSVLQRLVKALGVVYTCLHTAQDLQEPQDPLETLDPLELQEILDLQVRLESLVLQVVQVILDPQVLQV